MSLDLEMSLASRPKKCIEEAQKTYDCERDKEGYSLGVPWAAASGVSHLLPASLSIEAGQTVLRTSGP